MSYEIPVASRSDQRRQLPAPKATTFIELPCEYGLETVGNVGVGAAANTVYVSKHYINRPISVARIAFMLTSGQATAIASVGIYSEDGTTKLIDSGAKSIPDLSNSTPSTIVTAVMLKPEIYCLAWTLYTGDASNITARLGGMVNSTIGAQRLLRNLNVVRIGRATNTAVAGGLPASLGTLTNGTTPGIPFVGLYSS